MAVLTVTFSTVFPPSDPQHAHAPIMVGRSARTERIDVGAASSGGNIGALSAAQSENVVNLHPESDCWVVIGADPSVEAGEGWRLEADQTVQFWVELGEKVAVIEA